MILLGIVTGVIRGARTVRINPTGADTYETVLEIDQDMVAYLFGKHNHYNNLRMKFWRSFLIV